MPALFWTEYNVIEHTKLRNKYHSQLKIMPIRCLHEITNKAISILFHGSSINTRIKEDLRWPIFILKAVSIIIKTRKFRMVATIRLKG